MGVTRPVKPKGTVAPTEIAPGVVEALRVIDVAGAVRRSHRSSEDLAGDARYREQLRRTLVQQARRSGDMASEADIDAAIDLYLTRPREYAAPRWSFSLLVAHLWVRRGRVVIGVAIAVAALAVLWLMLFVSTAIA